MVIVAVGKSARWRLGILAVMRNSGAIYLYMPGWLRQPPGSMRVSVTFTRIEDHASAARSRPSTPERSRVATQ